MCGFVPNRLKETHAKDRRRQKFTQSQFEFAATSIQQSLRSLDARQPADRTCVRRNLLKIIIPSGEFEFLSCDAAALKCMHEPSAIDFAHLRHQAPPTADRKLIMYPNKMLLCDLADRKITRRGVVCAMVSNPSVKW
jgi:hypothetical protein